MKVALIPPPSVFRKVDDRVASPDGWHMILPDSCKDPEYFSHYSAIGVKGASEYRILDNGAAEAGSLEGRTLVELAKAVHADEVVMPDVLGDHTATIKMAQEFSRHIYRGINYVGVLQGQTLAQCMACFNVYLGMPHVRTVAIPRLVLDYCGREGRAALVEQILKAKSSMSIHLLGTNIKYPNEVAMLSHRFPDKIRSVDTSMPYNYARYGFNLITNRAIPRSHDWNTYVWDKEDIRLASDNCKIFTAWSRGEAPSGVFSREKTS